MKRSTPSASSRSCPGPRCPIYTLLEKKSRRPSRPKPASFAAVLSDGDGLPLSDKIRVKWLLKKLASKSKRSADPFSGSVTMPAH